MLKKFIILRRKGNMNIEDFLPKYPNVDKSQYELLNPYPDENFYESIYKKKEFYENKLDKTEDFPNERGVLMKHQKTIARFLSSHTPYDRLLLVHAMGSGKTCSAIGAIEQIRSENSTIDRAIIIAKGESILDNFTQELLWRCTAGEYIPDNYDKLSPGEKVQRTRKKREVFYDLKTMQKFSKDIKRMSAEDITNNYSNKIIVIDEVHNLRIQPEKKAETLEVYQQYHRFLHLVKNCKVLLLSGTPMKDSPDEIASVMNLILPVDKQLPYGEDFLNEFMDEKEGVYTVKPSKVVQLQHAFKGRVSFLRSMYSDVRTEYIGKRLGSLKHFIVDGEVMSKFQSKAYIQAYKSDRSGKMGVYSKSREASLFVYPDGSYGSEGFNKYIRSTKRKKTFDIQVNKGKSRKVFKTKYALDPSLIQVLRGSTIEETLNNIGRYSSKYEAVLRQIVNRSYEQKRGECCFVYSSIVHGSGAILFSLLLELIGYSKATGRESSKSPRYVILTGDTSSKIELRRLRDRFNKPDNLFGEYIQVIIGSKTVSEGFSFKHIQFEAILTPHFNYSETAQALARGIRLNSHNDLIKAGVNPVVMIMQTVSLPRPKDMKKDIISVDLYFYELSEDKDVSIRAILRIIMEAAFDCALNYFRNHINGKDGSRECDYTTCNYKCTGMNMQSIMDGLENKDIDYSTYQLYYANPKTTKIQKSIENLLRQNAKMDMESIIKNLEGDFSKWEIENALQSLVERIEEDKDFDYKQFLEVYSSSGVRKIMKDIEGLFSYNFYMNITEIMGHFRLYTEFEVLTALRTLINDNVIIFNKYGLPSYLREQYDVYFLVNNLSVTDNFFSGYYTQYPNIITNKNFDQITHELYTQSLPTIVRTICKTTAPKNFANLVKSLPINIQEFFVESALIAKDKGITKNKNIQDLILNYFKNYIKNIDGTLVSTLREDDGILRCKEDETWRDCPPEFKTQVKEAEYKQKEKLRKDNPYGLIGLINPEKDNAFCLVDLRKEEQSVSKLKQKKKGDDVKDTRAIHTGKVCSAGGWKLNDLISLVVKRMQIDPPKSFKIPGTEEQVREAVKNDKYGRVLFTDEELEQMNLSKLRRIMYWVLPESKGGKKGIKPICAEIKKWMEEHNLIQIDNQCGVRGTVKGTVEKKQTRNYRIETINPRKDTTKFKDNKDIPKLMKDCFNIDKYKHEINDDIWVMAYIRKLVAFIVIRDGKIVRACVASNYRRQGIPNEVMGHLVRHSKISMIEMDNRDKNYNLLLKLYKKFGFNVTKDTGKVTTMEYAG